MYLGQELTSFFLYPHLSSPKSADLGGRIQHVPVAKGDTPDLIPPSIPVSP
jgi:hypothetical protein